MSLIDCPECRLKVSDRAEACPHCGFPVREQQREESFHEEEASDEIPSPKPEAESPPVEPRPSPEPGTESLPVEPRHEKEDQPDEAPPPSEPLVPNATEARQEVPQTTEARQATQRPETTAPPESPRDTAEPRSYRTRLDRYPTSIFPGDSVMMVFSIFLALVLHGVAGYLPWAPDRYLLTIPFLAQWTRGIWMGVLVVLGAFFLASGCSIYGKRKGDGSIYWWLPALAGLLPVIGPVAVLIAILSDRPRD